MIKFKWIPTVKPFTLAAQLTSNLREDENFDLIQAWCQEHSCGLRISYNMFRFKNDEEISMFMLRWS